jgi:hypothetical protein
MHIVASGSTREHVGLELHSELGNWPYCVYPSGQFVLHVTMTAVAHWFGVVRPHASEPVQSPHWIGLPQPSVVGPQSAPSSAHVWGTHVVPLLETAEVLLVVLVVLLAVVVVVLLAAVLATLVLATLVLITPVLAPVLATAPPPPLLTLAPPPLPAVAPPFATDAPSPPDVVLACPPAAVPPPNDGVCEQAPIAAAHRKPAASTRAGVRTGARGDEERTRRATTPAR